MANGDWWTTFQIPRIYDRFVEQTRDIPRTHPAALRLLSFLAARLGIFSRVNNESVLRSRSSGTNSGSHQDASERQIIIYRYLCHIITRSILEGLDQASRALSVPLRFFNFATQS